MTSDSVVQLVRETFLTALWISAPLLAVGFIAGILMSLVQILTSIQDAAFSAIPRLLAFLAALLFLMPWMLSHMVSYSTTLFGDLGRYAR
jgi:flagellar biosynthetic protein FliQ